MNSALLCFEPRKLFLSMFLNSDYCLLFDFIFMIFLISRKNEFVKFVESETVNRATLNAIFRSLVHQN